MEKASHFYVYGRSAKYLTSVLIMKALVGTFNQEKAIVGAFSVITNLRVDLRSKLYPS